MHIIEEKNHNSLIDFYCSRGIEFGDDKQYYHPPVYSYVAKIDNKFVAAITICKEGDNYILDEVAVIPERERQGICTKLVETCFDRIKKDSGGGYIYLVAKNPSVFLGLGFELIKREEAPSFSECFTCPDFQVKCFPKVMLKKL